MQHKIEVQDKPGIFDAVGAGIKKDIRDLGIKGVREARFIQVYLLEGELSQDEVVRICEELLADKVVQEYSILTQDPRPRAQDGFLIEIAYNPGVMDPVEESALKGIRDLGVSAVTAVKTAKKYLLKGRLSAAQLKTITEKLLYNKLIQHVVKSAERRAPVTEQAGD